MCGCCRLTVGGKVRYACIHGPEFDGHLVDFDEAISRSKMYGRRRKAAYVQADRGGEMMDKTLRHALPAREASERIKDFFEVSPGFSEQTALAEAARCLSCKNAPCMKGCPVGVHIPDFIAALRTEGAQAAAAVILRRQQSARGLRQGVSAGKSMRKVLHKAEKLGGSVSIGALERFVADHAPETEKTRPAPCGISVAVVGSGPAGLSCAADLAKAGAKVTVFEALHKAGGVLEYGIPEFRLPKAVVDKEIKALEALGVEIRCDEVVGRSVTLPELMETHDAVFIGSGAGLPLFLGIEGETLCGVLSANELLDPRKSHEGLPRRRG